jgi:methylmalonyl-CoA mutase
MALEKVFGRHEARVQDACTGVYRSETMRAPSGQVDAIDEVRAIRPRSRRAPAAGRASCVAKMGQDGHDRGQKVIATALSDLGFDVDVGPLFQTPERVRTPGRRERRARRRSSARSRQVTSRSCPELRDALAKRGRPDILIVVGGVIPPGDVHDAAPRRRRVTRSSGRARSIARAAKELLARSSKRTLPQAG